MNPERDVTPIVTAWLEQRGRGLPDAERGFDRLLKLVDATPQRRRRWLPLGDSRPDPAGRLPGTTPRPSGPLRLGSATRFAAAMAVLALGSGALYLGTGQAPAPSTTLAIITEKVEPGIMRVSGDGLHVLGRPADQYYQQTLGPDGSVWVWTSDDLYRLGDPGTGILETAHQAGLNFHSRYRQLAVAVDGTVWASERIGTSELGHFDGSQWQEMPPHPGLVEAIDVASDGSVWATTWDGGVAVLRGTVWTDTPFGEDVAAVLASTYHDVNLGPIKAATGGDVWVAWVAGTADGRGRGGLLRFDGQAWSLVAPVGPGDYRGVETARLDIGADDTLWVYFETVGDPSGVPIEPHLARLVGDEWTVYSAAQGVPFLNQPDVHSGHLKVAADGTVWVTAYVRGSEAQPGGAFDCDGVRSFDGDAWTSYLPGRCVKDLDIASDGAVWVVEAVPERYYLVPRDTYRIDPGVRR